MGLKIPNIRANADARRQQIQRGEEDARLLLGGDLSEPTIETGTDFQVELSIGWVDIDTVFPMGAGIISAGEEEHRSQPRTFFSRERLDALKALLKTDGQISPAWVYRIPYPSADGTKRYNLIDGERRWRVARELRDEGDTRFERFLIRVLDEKSRGAFRLSVIADVHNEAHSSIERGRAILHLRTDMEAELEEFLTRIHYDKKPLDEARLEAMRHEFEHEKVALWIPPVLERAAKTKRTPKVQLPDLEPLVALSDKSIRNYIKQTELEPEFVAALEEGKIGAAHGTALISLPTEAQRKKLFRKIIKENLSTKDAEREATIMRGSSQAPAPAKTESAALAELRGLVARTQRLSKTDLTEEEKEAGQALLNEWESAMGELRAKWG